MTAIDISYDTRIPNNVGLSSDRKVLKALEKWHPGYLDWWNRLIPQNFQESMVYLRTAVSVDPKGWAKFDYVKMPEYRWVCFWHPRLRAAQSLAVNMPVNRRGKKCPVNTATCLNV